MSIPQNQQDTLFGDDGHQVKRVCTEHYMEALAGIYGFPPAEVRAAFHEEDPFFAKRVCEAIEGQLEAEGVISPRRRGERLDAWAIQNRRGIHRHSSKPGPSGGPTVEPKQGPRFPKRTNAQIAAALKALGD